MGEGIKSPRGLTLYAVIPAQAGIQLSARSGTLPELEPGLRRGDAAEGGEIGAEDQTRRSTIIFLISAMALAGDRPFGHVLAQFMIVWQR